MSWAEWWPAAAIAGGLILAGKLIERPSGSNPIAFQSSLPVGGPADVFDTLVDNSIGLARPERASRNREVYHAPRTLPARVSQELRDRDAQRQYDDYKREQQQLKLAQLRAHPAKPKPRPTAVQFTFGGPAAGRKGGLTTFRRYGRQFYRDIAAGHQPDLSHAA